MHRARVDRRPPVLNKKPAARALQLSEQRPRAVNGAAATVTRLEMDMLRNGAGQFVCRFNLTAQR